MPWIVTRKGERIWSGPAPGTPGTIYILCFGEPRVIRSSDGGPLAGVPGSHYVGITWAKDPLTRIKAHGAWCANHVVELRHGTEAEEQLIKLEEDCPACGKSLNYYLEREEMHRAAQSDVVPADGPSGGLS